VRQVLGLGPGLKDEATRRIKDTGDNQRPFR